MARDDYCCSCVTRGCYQLADGLVLNLVNAPNGIAMGIGKIWRMHGRFGVQAMPEVMSNTVAFREGATEQIPIFTIEEIKCQFLLQLCPLQKIF